MRNRRNFPDFRGKMAEKFSVSHIDKGFFPHYGRWRGVVREKAQKSQREVPVSFQFPNIVEFVSIDRGGGHQ
jgi:hypothetical protein